jgi:hypothetical protein
VTTVADSTLTRNEADGDRGGAGLGGAYNDDASRLAMIASLLAQNRADGSQGIGGGVYNLGMFAFDAATVIAHNYAFTSNDDIFP